MHHRKKYPPNWKQLSRACKDAAGWICERCGVKHGTRRYSTWTGREWPVYLQAAHRYHDPHNATPDLVCVCPTCHWKYFRRPGASARSWLYHERRKHRILLERAGYHGPWRPFDQDGRGERRG